MTEATAATEPRDPRLAPESGARFDEPPCGDPLCQETPGTGGRPPLVALSTAGWAETPIGDSAQPARRTPTRSVPPHPRPAPSRRQRLRLSDPGSIGPVVANGADHSRHHQGREPRTVTPGRHPGRP